jgi:hypothetical protein
MFRANPKFYMWSAKGENHHRRHTTFADTSAAASMSSTASSLAGDARLQVLVNTRLVINNAANEDYSPARSGIICLARDVGIKGLKSQVWSLLCSDKFTHDRVPWEDYIAKFALGVKWMAGNIRMPDTMLETDDEVRTAIEGI